MLGDSVVLTEAATRAIRGRGDDESHILLLSSWRAPCLVPKLAASPAGWARTCVQRQVACQVGAGVPWLKLSNAQSRSRKEGFHLRLVPQTSAEHCPGASAMPGTGPAEIGHHPPWRSSVSRGARHRTTVQGCTLNAPATREPGNLVREQLILPWGWG